MENEACAFDKLKLNSRWLNLVSSSTRQCKEDFSRNNAKGLNDVNSLLPFRLTITVCEEHFQFNCWGTVVKASRGPWATRPEYEDLLGKSLFIIGDLEADNWDPEKNDLRFYKNQFHLYMNSPLLIGQEIEAGNRFWNSYGNGSWLPVYIPFRWVSLGSSKMVSNAKNATPT